METGGPTHHHRLIVPHPRDAGLIAIERARGIALPSVDTVDHHTADVGHINDAVLQHYCVNATVRCSLLHGEPRDGVVERVHVLELHGSVELEWRPVKALVSELPVDDRRALDLWLARHGAIDGPEWTASGWYAGACRWIERRTRDAGLGPPLRIRQLRAWESSCVLEVQCETATAYFKALPRSGDVEFAVTRWLSEVFPDIVPRIIADDVSRRWLLMEGCAGVTLEDVTDMTTWARAARRYGQLQVACAARSDTLRALGCRVRDLTALVPAIASLAGDREALCVGEPAGVTELQLEQLRDSLPALERRCVELDGIGIPHALEHGDLWPGNVFVDLSSGACAIIDWEDAAIAHPFLGLAPLTVGLGSAGLATPDNLATIEHEYAAAFEPFGSVAQLCGAIARAAPLCFLDMALRYRAERSAMVALHPWMRDLVPYAVRLALERL
jgi:Phosphotransferase enzyme family